MFMPCEGGYGGDESLLFKLPARRGSANPAAAPRGSVRGDGRHLRGWTMGKQASDPHGHLSDQGAVLLLAPHDPNSPSSGPFVGVQRALLFRFFQRGVLDQNALSLIAPARPAEAHHHGRALAILGGAPRQCGVARRKIFEI